MGLLKRNIKQVAIFTLRPQTFIIFPKHQKMYNRIPIQKDQQKELEDNYILKSRKKLWHGNIILSFSKENQAILNGLSFQHCVKEGTSKKIS